MVCSSISWPNMFDSARGRVSLYTDLKSITNRVKLLLLTDPTEMYMNPTFGVGLRKYMFRYNNDNTVALIKDNLIEQLRLWEPAVVPEETKVVRGLTEGVVDQGYSTEVADLNHLKLTITLTTVYSDTVEFDITGADLGKDGQFI